MKDIILRITKEILNDDSNESGALLNYYEGCNQEQKSAINEFCIYLCGWSFETIIEMEDTDNEF